MKNYIKLLRTKHYIKNLLIFVPLFFAQSLFYQEKFYQACMGSLAFCFISSAVYILNDLKDIEKDRIHPVKKERPIASGKIKTGTAVRILFICIFLSVFMNLLTGSFLRGSIYIIGYFILNLSYSFGLKNKPLADIVILTSGFVIRIYYGAMITNTDISVWLYLVIMVGACYMGLGKRRNEMRYSLDTRHVLKYYSYDFLDKNMYVCVALLITFYSFWTIEFEMTGMRWTTPYVMVILMKYSLVVEGNSDCDPVEVLVQDKLLILLITGYILWIFCVLYLL